jgi:predicted GNAT family N-acyltransferase
MKFIAPADVQKELLAVSKQLAASSSNLVNASKTTQEQLGAAAKALGGVVVKLASLGKSMGGNLTGDGTAQQNMLSSVKAVALSAQQLVSVAKVCKNNVLGFMWKLRSLKDIKTILICKKL